MDWVEAAVEKLREWKELNQKSFAVTGINTALNCRDDHLVRRAGNDSDDKSDEEFCDFTREESAPKISDYSDSDMEFTVDD